MQFMEWIEEQNPVKHVPRNWVLGGRMTMVTVIYMFPSAFPSAFHNMPYCIFILRYYAGSGVLLTILSV